MRILFISRPSLFKHPGGDTLHIEQTAEQLRLLGHEVELATARFVSPHNFDLMHFFNLGQPAVLIPYLSAAKNLPLVVSTIYIDYSVVPNPAASKKERLLNNFNYYWQEYFKTLARSFKGQEKMPHWEYLLDGQKASIERVMRRASAIIGASDWELQYLTNTFGFRGRKEKLLLGTEHINLPEKALPRSQQRVVCAARIEPLKNQHLLIAACKKLGYHLTLVGQASRNHKKYYQYCTELAEGEVSFLGKLNRQNTLREIAQAKIHAMPSFYETTGLSTLEALYCGCQVVVSNHPIQRELFEGRAHFANPYDQASLEKALLDAMADKSRHNKWVKEKFSWALAGLKIDEIYQSLVSG